MTSTLMASHDRRYAALFGPIDAVFLRRSSAPANAIWHFAESPLRIGDLTLPGRACGPSRSNGSQEVWANFGVCLSGSEVRHQAIITLYKGNRL
jgi:hypothetical protein